MRRRACARRLGAALAWAALGLSCATTAPTPDARRVTQVTLEGTREVPAGEVAQRLVTTASSWLPEWVPLLGHVTWWDEAAWQADVRRILRVYEARGYYQAQVLSSEVDESHPGEVRLKVVLSEGAPARVTALQVEGLPAAADAHLQASRAALREGDVFTEVAWAAWKAQVLAALRETGYPEAVLEARANVRPEAATVEVGLKVAAGQQYRFGRTFVATDPGAEVPARLVADFAAPDVPAGEVYAESKLAVAQARLYQLGVFGAVKVTRGAASAEEGTVPVVVDVREAPFRTLRLGGGFGGDLIHQEARVVAEYSHRNLGLARLFFPDARLDRLTLKAKLGWAVLPNIVEVARGSPQSRHGPVARLFADYEVPRAFGQRTLSVRTSVDISRTLDNAFDYLGGEARLGLTWRPTLDVAVTPTLNFNAYLLNSPVALAGAGPQAAVGCPLAPALCSLAFADVTVEWDRRDDRLEPRSGTWLGLNVQAGLSTPATGGLLPYLRVSPEARAYVSFGPEARWTLSAKLRAGGLFAQPGGDPIVARFFSGGSLMRGFNQQRLSPQVALATARPEYRTGGTLAGAPCDPLGAPDCTLVTARDFANAQSLPIGGNGLLEASVELRWNVWGDLVLAVFTDWGVVSRRFFTEAPRQACLSATPGCTLVGAGPWWQRVYAAVGLGLRYRTPIGPIRLDVGFRLPFVGGPQEVEELERSPEGVLRYGRNADGTSGGCFFGLGGQAEASYAGAPENLCSFHLSIGEAF